ncbi:MAG: T9SS type A sorting domain-containing protein [Bacteroidota bacterium]
MRKTLLMMILSIGTSYVYSQATRTYSGGSWDVDPVDGDLLIIDDDLVTARNYLSGGVTINSGASVTVGAGTTLELSGGSISFEGNIFTRGSADLVSDYFVGGTTDVSYVESSTDKVQGAASFEITFSDAGSSESYIASKTPGGAGMSLTGGQGYLISFWAKGVSQNPDNRMEVGVAAGFNLSAGTGSGLVSLTDDWVKYTYVYTPNASGTNFRILVLFNTIRSTAGDGSNAGTFYVDDIRISDISTMPTLTVNSGGSLITTAAEENLESATINRTTSFSDGRYSFVGSPVAQSSGVLGSDLGSFVFKYDETIGFDGDDGLSRWADASADQLVPGVGYTQASQQEISFTGVPNDGTITIFGLTKTTVGTASESNQGWHLLSNPYPAAVDITAFLAANTDIAGSISIWEDGGSDNGRRTNADYITASTIATVNGSAKNFEGYIGSAQGFFIKANTNNADVSFTEGMRVNGNNADANFFRSAQIEGVKLSISSSDNTLFNELFVGFLEDATEGVDRLYDAPKFISSNPLQFYSLIEDNKYAIQGLPLSEGSATELVYNAELAGEYTLKVEDLVIANSDMSLVLSDLVTGKSYDLGEINEFSFSSEAGSDQNRFLLTYSSTILGNEVLSSEPIYRIHQNVLNVSFNANTQIKAFAVYDLAGKIISSQDDIDATSSLNIPVAQDAGIQIVRIVTDQGSFTRKFNF